MHVFVLGGLMLQFLLEWPVSPSSRMLTGIRPESFELDALVRNQKIVRESRFEALDLGTGKAIMKGLKKAART